MTSRTILHYDPDRIDYAVTEVELRQLEEASNPTWRDVCLTSSSLFLGFASNALGEFAAQSTFTLTPGLFFNSMIAAVSLVSALAFGVAWKRAAVNRHLIFGKIRNKPRVILRAESLEIEDCDGAQRSQSAHN